MSCEWKVRRDWKLGERFMVSVLSHDHYSGNLEEL